VGLLVLLAVELLCVVTAWLVAVRARGSAIGPLFITVAFFFHGFIELARSLLPPPPDKTFVSGLGDLRRFATDDSLRTWRVWAMFAIVVFTAVYVGAMTWRQRPPSDVVMPTKLVSLPWFVTAPIALALWPAMVRFSQLNAEGTNQVATQSGASYWASGLARQFLLVLTALAVVDFGLRRKARWRPVLLALVVACGFTLVIGQRSEVVTVALMSLGALWWYGARPSRRMVVLSGAFIVLCTITLTLARSEIGRQEFIKGDAGSRVQNLAHAADAIIDRDSALEAASNMANRFDGNAFPALVLDAQESTEWRSGLVPIEIGARLAVPSFLDPTKNDSRITDRSEKEYLKAGYGMLFDFDFLPTQFGSALAMGGLHSLLLFAALAAGALAAFDKYLRRRTEIRLVLGVCVAEGVLGNYEADLSSWPVLLRGVLVFVLLIMVLTLLRTLMMRNGARPSPLGEPGPDRPVRKPVVDGRPALVSVSRPSANCETFGVPELFETS
jgi:hypothetical protein